MLIVGRLRHPRRAASRCGSCPTTGTSSECLPGPPATSTRMLSGSPVIGRAWSSGAVFIHWAHASSSKWRRNTRAGHAGAVEEVRATRRRGEKPSLGEAVRVLGPEDDEELALADRRVVHAERRHRRRDLVEDQLRVAVLLHVVHVVRALAAVHGDRARRVDAATARRTPPTGDSSRFSAAQNVYFAGWPWVAASPEPGRAPATCSSTQPHRAADRGVGAVARAERADARRRSPRVSAISPCTSTSGATGCVVAFTPRRFISGRGERAHCGEHDGERLRRAAGEHGVDGDDPPA